MLFQKSADGGLEFVFAEVELRLPQERRGLVVNDVAVGGFCGGEIFYLLIDRRRALGRIGLVRALFDAFVKHLPRIHLGHYLF
jgi:hypothetical protein